MTGWINPVSFGAVGDGIAFDDAAFAAAVASIGSTGTILIEPGKNFRLSGEVVIPSYISVQFMGLGPEVSRVTISAASNGFRQTNVVGAPLTKGVGFSNFKLVGQGALSGIKLVGAGSPGIDSRVQRIQINHMSISGFSVEAIRLEKATNFLLTDMFLFNNGNAVRTLNAGDGKITGVKTGSNTGAAFLIEGGLGGAWDEGVNLHGNQLNGDHKGVVFKNMYYCWLVSTQVGSTTAGAVIIDNTDNCTISASEISNALGNADGIVMLNSPQRASIVGNFINGCRNYGAVLRGSGTCSPTTS